MRVKLKRPYLIVLLLIGVFFNSNAQNILTNPGLDTAGVDPTVLGNTLGNTQPDGWLKTNTPDRATEVERTFHNANFPRSASPTGGFYYGFRALSGAPEGIGQMVNVIAGRQYSFSFDYLIETQPSRTSCTPELQIRLGGVVMRTIPAPSSENVWERPIYTFVAPSTGSFLFEFFSGGACSTTWNFVDALNLQIADSDGDGIDDLNDLDDDDDGILDTVESGGINPSADNDGDGVPNYKDADLAGFVDLNTDGINDNFDLDLDGIPNHFDIDSDRKSVV